MPTPIPTTYRRLLPLLLLPLALYFLLNRVDNASSSSTGAIPVEAIIRIAEADLLRSQRAYIDDPDGLKRDRKDLGFKLEGSATELGLEGYGKRLEKALQQEFGWDGRPESTTAAYTLPYTANISESSAEPTSPPNFLSTLNHLSLDISPSLSPYTQATRQLPKHIYTTHHKPEFPSQFAGWKSVNPDYELSFLDDAALDRWIVDAFGGTAVEREWVRLGEYVDRAREGEARIKRKRMSGALRADLFR